MGPLTHAPARAAPATRPSRPARTGQAARSGAAQPGQHLPGVELEKTVLVGADLVEVIPTGVGSADPAALAGDRVVREILTGVAMRRGAE